MTTPEYLSRAMAAELLGLTERGVDAVIKRGDLPVARPGIRNRRSLLRTDVEQLAERRRLENAERRQRAAELTARRSERTDLPGHEWLSATQVAHILGCTGVWVRRLAHQGRLPHEVRGGRYRFRQDLIELVRNARVAQTAA